MKVSDRMKDSKWIRGAIDIGIFLLVPVICFFLMEFYTHNPFEEVRPIAKWLNIFLFELIAWIIFLISGSIKIALRSELGIAMVFGLANAYVVRFRTNPIVPWDLLSWKTAASVASNYDFTPDTRMVVVTILFLLLMVAVSVVKLKFTSLELWKRIVPALGVIMLLVFFAGRLQDEEYQTSHKLYPFLFTPVYMTDVNGIAVTFTMNLAYMSIDKPEGYDGEEMAALYEDFVAEEDSVSENDSASQGSTLSEEDSLPNMIVIMNEAFSDLAALGEFECNEDYMPFIHSLQDGAENTITGTLNVSVCGGNTANSEFEFLTGSSMAFLPQGSIPYQQYIKGEIDALPSYLSSLGYKTVGMHPYGASGWERDEVYPWLGFEETMFLSDFVGENYIRKYVSDESCYDEIISLYEEKNEAEPLFVFNVTMQNHGAYGDVYDNFTPDISVEGADIFSLEQYLSLMKVSDAAFEELINYFAQEEEKTLVVFFGDHQPNDTIASPIVKLNGKSVKNLSEEELKMRYEVPYVIWANYDIAEAQNEDTSLNYLGAHVLEQAGIERTGMWAYLEELEEEYPVISSMRVITSEGADTNATVENEGLQLYQSLQYYMLFEK